MLLATNILTTQKLMKYIKTKNYKIKRNKIRESLKSKIIYDKKIAKGFSDPKYYYAMGQEVLNLERKEGEKLKMSRPKCSRLTSLFEKYKKMINHKRNGAFFILKGIYDKNKTLALANEAPPTHGKLLSLVTSVPMLLLAYSRVKRNKGALSLGAPMAFNRLKNFNPIQRRFMSRTSNSPDGINYDSFVMASKLLKQGLYPWGASKRIYIPKPGQPGNLRPITIPPFMDRIVQASILRVLEAVYEPWFEKLNKSFGFRPGKGCHDAIFSLTRKENRGLTTAIEGDIKGAYDKVKKEILLSILEKRIKDRKFLNLLKKRLDYIYFDSSSRKYVTDQLGIPQGGIDSPYLWNIYMHEFDIHINEYLTNYLTDLNNKVQTRKIKKKPKTKKNKTEMKKSVNKRVQYGTTQSEESRVLYSVRERIRTLMKFVRKHPTLDHYNDFIKYYNGLSKESQLKIRHIRAIKAFYSDLSNFKDHTVRPEAYYKLIKELKKLAHTNRNLPAAPQNKLKLRYVYCRYADDWIILGNFNKLLAEKIKTYVAKWLTDNLAATLSMEKTIITDIRTEPAHFLGFEIRSRLTRKLTKTTRGKNKKPTLVRTAGQEVNAWPDKQRLISRLHMKGYCNKVGKPKALAWLTNLEVFTIIERFNAVLRGFTNYYNGFLHFPSSLSRWIYIIRTAAIKTIARKLGISQKKVYIKYRLKTKYGYTIRCSVNKKIITRGKVESYVKNWVLLTYRELKDNNQTALNRYKTVEKRFYDIEFNNKLPPYEESGKTIPSITSDNYLDKIVWVNLRTHASFDLPCSLCGSDQNIQMHHIKHIRKTPYYDLPDNKPWLKTMALRNRNQIPVCRDCHMNKIHSGTYHGANLKTLRPQISLTDTGYDLRVINFENYLNPSKKEYFSKSLEEKGWRLKTREFLTKKTQ